MADIPDIAAAVADANRRKTLHETSVQAKKSRRTPYNGSNASLPAAQEAVWAEMTHPVAIPRQVPTKTTMNEEFGKYIHTIKCTLY